MVAGRGTPIMGVDVVTHSTGAEAAGSGDGSSKTKIQGKPKI